MVLILQNSDRFSLGNYTKQTNKQTKNLRSGFQFNSDAYAVPVWCCFDFVDFEIPAKKMVSAVKTHSHYPVPAIVVTTPRTEICVKPDEAWIKKYNGEAALEMKKQYRCTK
uniref:Chemokine (C-C motif) ligand 39, duplicate 2 n=1 Tax=Sinocyclocheilus rhinocerous TaxID=307959 RepID=A0A673JNG4_9TELE